MKKLFTAASVAALMLCGPANATNICTVSLTTAQTATTYTAVNLGSKPQALTIQSRFSYVASAATSATMYIQTTIDGVNWIDIAAIQNTTSTTQQFVNVLGMTAVTTPTTYTDGALTANTTVAGVLGLQYRCKLTSVGTYGAGTTFTIDVQPR